jgi:hypothetical protein
VKIIEKRGQPKVVPEPNGGGVHFTRKDDETWKEYFAAQHHDARVTRLELYAFGEAVGQATIARMRRERYTNQWHRRLTRWLARWWHRMRIPAEKEHAAIPGAAVGAVRDVH